MGLPWEIYRTTNLTQTHPHTIDIYAKDGDVVEYYSRLSLIDQYGVGLVILTAGSTKAINPLNEAAFSILIPAVEEEARHQAQRYLGNSRPH